MMEKIHKIKLFGFVFRSPQIAYTHMHAQELFISYLTQQTHKKCAHKKDLNYNDLSNFVQEEEKLEFLHQIVPKKITVKEFREILERGSESEDSDDDESESENSDDGDEVEEEDEESASDASEDDEDGGAPNFFLFFWK